MRRKNKKGNKFNPSKEQISGYFDNAKMNYTKMFLSKKIAQGWPALRVVELSKRMIEQGEDKSLIGYVFHVGGGMAFAEAQAQIAVIAERTPEKIPLDCFVKTFMYAIYTLHYMGENEGIPGPVIVATIRKMAKCSHYCLFDFAEITEAEIREAQALADSDMEDRIESAFVSLRELEIITEGMFHKCKKQ